MLTPQHGRASKDLNSAVCACCLQIIGPGQVARRSDVDMNQHLNNVTYLAWCLETVPLDVYTNCQLHQVREQLQTAAILK